MFANAMGKSAEINFFFDEFEIDSLKRKLYKSGQIVHLKPKTFDLLLTLVEHQGEVLSKRDLFKLVWANQYVEENNLTVHIAALRKALGETKNNTRFIITVPGRGYRFIGELSDPNEAAIAGETRKIGQFVVEEDAAAIVSPKLIDAETIAANAAPVLVEADQIVLQPLNAAAALKPGKQNQVLFKLTKRHLAAIGLISAAILGVIAAFLYFNGKTKIPDSIAVLPFVNIGDDPNMEYLSDGITESLINNLSQSPNLKVIARNSVFKYKASEADSLHLNLPKIADELGGVQDILTGRVEKRGDDLMISLELVDVRDNTIVWGEHYNRKFADVFAVQEELAGDIAGKLRIKLGGEERREIAKRYTDNLKAFEFYMMGCFYIHRRTREDLEKAEHFYELAIKEDQNYALAYAGLAETYGNLGVRSYISPVEGRQKLEAAARKAVLLDEQLAQAHVMLGYYYMGFVPYNLAEGDRELRRAIELSPSLAIAHLYLSLSLFRQDKLDEGLTEMLKGRELDPFSAIIARQVALYYCLKREPARALDVLREADRVGPPFTTTIENGVYVQNRVFDETLAALAKEEQTRKDDPIIIAGRGMIFAAQGKRKEAVEIIKDLQRMSGSEFGNSQWIAKIYILLGEKEEAIKQLENGFNAGTIGAVYKDEPLWDLLRPDARFTELMRRMGIPP
jgi:TolB-like protein/DNA-binding winged helix-turn-helix (wHTH) protein